ncbi:uncharacterized protein LOC118425822 [Branchiostoma floridae]|uniref:Uncharacterized protein LOC118425822 n=1 Tax=Branchiostoma floridae TaxID=7739 RepID=A0A9J7LY09_BRAFL|nr:uncharacterized protein LOC118425822 [Branchiostoma floridae]
MSEPATPPAMSEPATPPAMSEPATPPAMSKPATPPAMSEPASTSAMSKPTTVPVMSEPTSSEQASKDLQLTLATHENIVHEASKHGFIYVATTDAGTLILAKLKVIKVDCSVSIQIDINKDGTWQLKVQGKKLSCSNHDYLHADLSPVLTESMCASFFFYLSHCHFCSGNVGYDALLNARREGMDLVTFRKVDGSVAAKEEVGTDSRTIRHVDCQLLLPPNRMSARCDRCITYGHYLRGAVAKIRDKQNTSISHDSKIPHKHLSREQLEAKVNDAQREKKYQKSCAAKIRSRVGKAVDTEGCTLNDSQHRFLQQILESSTAKDTMDTTFAKDTPQQFLFQQQVERAKQHDARTMKWHPIMVRWCLAIYHSSPATYKFIRDSGFLFLPHTRTLDRYSKFTDPTSGFNPDVLKKLLEKAKIDELPEWKKNVTLLFDEMKVKSNLVYDKRTGELIGFTELGSINDEIKSFEKRCQSQQEDDTSGADPDLATHVLACMVRGIFTPLEFVFAYYPCCTFSSVQLFPVIWDATGVLTELGFHVRAFICDGASPNRRFYRLHGNEGEMMIYWAWNIHSENEKIYFFCDVPHLLKTTRNNFENSGAHSKTRHLHYNKQPISWQHIIKLYEWDLGLDREAVGLRMLKNLTHDHVFLTPSLRMRVSLAVQVLSKSVYHGLTMQGRHDTISTRKFVLMMDKFFDCLNVKNTESNKPVLYPYRNVLDARFTWLEEDFLGFLREWEEEAHGTPNLSKDDRNRMCLSKQTLEGLRITVASFTTLTKVLLQEDGVRYVLSEKFTQDPLEQHFSKQRHRCGANEHPTVMEYGRNELNILVTGEMAAAFRRPNGNWRGRGDHQAQIDFSDNTPLPKRPRKRSHRGCYSSFTGNGCIYCVPFTQKALKYLSCQELVQQRTGGLTHTSHQILPQSNVNLS